MMKKLFMGFAVLGILFLAGVSVQANTGESSNEFQTAENGHLG
ncbi:hypothetical protein QRD86_00305 (plasmid) [Bacillus halotolerans]|nr:hypothetical protein [Bacillus halotolerans]WJE41230.1 hypothetical protein QRD86_00305 [Bacillus halotolerans]